jgi:hypothetical protein
MPRGLTVAALLLALAGGVAHADPATAELAPGQLRFAEAELLRAQQALSQGDYDLARRLAAQAQLDARLAWSMSDSQFLRRDAAALHEQGALLRYQTAIRNRPVTVR